MSFRKILSKRAILLCGAILFALGGSNISVGGQVLGDPAKPAVCPTPAVSPESKAPTGKGAAGSSTVSGSVAKVKVGDSEIQVVTSQGTKAEPVYFRPHENETTSADATKEIIKNYGGTFVELKSKGERLITFSIKNKTYTFDPNRMFTTVGVVKTLQQYGGSSKEAESEVSKFAGGLEQRYFNGKNLVVAVHNNTDGAPLTIETYKGSTDAAAININPERDPDDFFFVTTEAHFKFLKEKGFNVVLQNNAAVTDDGSLSVYCGKQQIPYINVEGEIGHLKQQAEMLNAIQALVVKDRGR
jgi:hypothetical protein